jgi:hypothetical protein
LQLQNACGAAGAAAPPAAEPAAERQNACGAAGAAAPPAAEPAAERVAQVVAIRALYLTPGSGSFWLFPCTVNGAVFELQAISGLPRGGALCSRKKK